MSDCITMLYKPIYTMPLRLNVKFIQCKASLELYHLGKNDIASQRPSFVFSNSDTINS